MGLPKLARELRDLIRRMSLANSTWGAPRIQSELHLLGHDVGESTVARYVARRPKPPSRSWRTFLANRLCDIAAIDFFTVTTATFRVLCCFVVLCHARRRVVHFNVTAHPTERWTSPQIVEAFPYDSTPRYLIRDRDAIYCDWFRRRVKHNGDKSLTSFPNRRQRRSAAGVPYSGAPSLLAILSMSSRSVSMVDMAMSPRFRFFAASRATMVPPPGPIMA